ncbi:MAG: hypothetical protein JST50_05825 [Bacteroidetes bacterium]|jgi:hypothetical protein|nr:hypothetical protein [Bacteroidota bacterium]
MIKIELKPLEGIVIENLGGVSLGQSRQNVERLLGPPSESYSAGSAFYKQYELRIDFDNFGKAEFIEFIYGPFPERTVLSIYGINPFTIGAEKLVEVLTEHNDGEVDLTEAELAYVFLEISVGIWRQFTQQDVEEGIAQRKLNGTYEFNKSSIEDDLEISKNFGTIGLGVVDYYR